MARTASTVAARGSALSSGDRRRCRSLAGRRFTRHDARAILQGGGNGSIIGRNCFQRPRAEALTMLAKLVDIYKGRG